MALPLVVLGGIAVAGTATSLWAYFSSEEAKANAENTKNLADLEEHRANNPERSITAAAILAAAVGASFIGYKYVSKK